MKRRKQQGFTLVELVASAVLAAMMMIALMNVVWSATRDARQLQQADLTRSSITQLIDRVRSDFQNARGVTTAGAVITLHGYLGENAETLDPTFTPATVQYRSKQIGEHRIMTRSVSWPGHTHTEPVWVGLGSLAIEALEEADVENKLEPDPAAGGLPDMPATLRVTMTSQDDQLLWREVLHHHEI